MLAAAALARPTRRAGRGRRARRRGDGRRTRDAAVWSTSSARCRASHVAQNTRLAVVFVLCAALLAGWGLDDLTDPERAGSRRRAVARPGAGGARGAARVGRAGRRPATALAPGRRPADRLGLRRPAQRGPRRRGLCRGGGHAALGLAARMARPGRRGPRAAGAAPGRQARPHSLRGGGRRARHGRPLQGRDGPQPRDPGRPRRAAGRPRAPPPPGPPAQPLRGPRRDGPVLHRIADPAGRGHAIRPQRRARLRLPGRGALPAPVAQPDRPRLPDPVLHHPGHRYAQACGC